MGVTDWAPGGPASEAGKALGDALLFNTALQRLELGDNGVRCGAAPPRGSS